MTVFLCVRWNGQEDGNMLFSNSRRVKRKVKMKTKTPVLYRDATYKADGFRDDGEIWEMARKRAYQPTVVSYKLEGFPVEPNKSGFPGVEFCRSIQVRPICGNVALWRVVKVGLRSISTGYYCDEHIDQQVDFSEMEESS